ncbi:acyl-CoA dehydrogenase family protein [Psychrobacter sp. B38]|uniref:acyl-CoA dehydrogenase family protein n=1 Tax=Psychrobacter sp. B38 TaxID=3143538 RepID=UPI00320F59F5
MSGLDTKSALLKNIQTAIENLIIADQQSTNAFVITDKLRHDILNLLVTYSEQIPHPASGTGNSDDGHEKEDKKNANTLIRWQVLAYVSSIDLTIAKWFESHLDALSILHEVGYDKSTQGLWAVWAAEGHPQPIQYQQGKISGTKAWCSGAHIVDHALMTYRDGSGQSQLVVVDMAQDGIEIDNSEWQAVGMQGTDTATVEFDEVIACNVGAANVYLDRVGFWHGAAGVAACWYGATASLATYLIKGYQQKPNDYKAMYLGQISTALSVTQQYFYHVSDLIDTQANSSHELIIRQLRANVEQLAREVLETVGQALGAAPFCRNAHFAKLSADLPVFIRQSHGAFDLQKIGELSSILANESITLQENIWQL